MHESLADMLNIMTGSPLESVVEKGIRGRAWLSHALWLWGLDQRPSPTSMSTVAEGLATS